MNELMFSGLQLVGCAVVFLVAGIGIGIIVRNIIEEFCTPDCEK